MIQTTEVWIVSCDKCSTVYPKNFRSKFVALKHLAKHKWDVESEKMIRCANCAQRGII